MSRRRVRSAQRVRRSSNVDSRLRLVGIICGLFAVLVGVRLFVLMIVEHDVYTDIATGSHGITQRLIPERGEIFIQDTRTGDEFPLAINKDQFIVFADTRAILDDEMAEDVAEGLAEVFSYDDEKKFSVYLQVNKRTDPYEPLEKNIEESVVEVLRELDLPGISYVRVPRRLYPEKHIASHVVGFVGKTEDGGDLGRYGIEGYWQQELAGNAGVFEGAKTAGGRWISIAGRLFRPAEDGVDLLLTIDRTLQFQSCEMLREAMELYEAEGASLIIMDPRNGAIRAMCSLPDFDVNDYSQVVSGNVYNNKAVFAPYEIGSIFKPIAMGAALNEGAVTPKTVFHDSGSKQDICQHPITNADGKIYGDTTMTGVLENSINTGMVYVVEQIGKKVFREYVEQFGFGIKEGIQIDTEASGTIDSLSENRGDNIDCYAATASFGQGITATPLQMVSAYSAIATGGELIKPYIVDEVRHSDGKVDKTKRTAIRRVLTPRTSTFLKGMLVNVIDSGQAKLARAPGYYIAGKTGTAQIPGPGGYTEDTNHSFIGFGPVDNPAFVMLIKLEKPKSGRFSSVTAAPTFGKIAQFLLEYYHIEPER
ncbi:MAG: penicillin-binding protein 2 [Candidatus Magasanikbacteria bacterium]|nr:penicillin-binding protein 2 [Candidatus Magasanikbacteria bacterium]MBT4221469.1 penicillin-binding protein 2 [Candidatus Magasanikbacteria bacterium]MBT4350683.1 penicillin-binding protein 2 [Candidatus Magasanikbacteria bacterium]MBT4541641.1 penicillin-binding protein 2 [Candidatus Magasanikbacteria bacterium]MBT6252916.1 penicillin-binding protein 2 [Candidatus Magasanikbacteria bacterium]